MSLDVFNKLDKALIERYAEVASVMAELNLPFLVIGASARDLFLSTPMVFPLQEELKTSILQCSFLVGRLLIKLEQY